MNVFREVRKLFEENRRITDDHQYTVPSSDSYPYQWLWDSCFHAIVLARYDIESAKAEIKSLLCKQFSNGLVPHIIYWTSGILHIFHWGTDGTSSLTQPPMIAYAVLEIHRRKPDTLFLASVFPSLVAYYQFLLTERDPHGHHLASIISPDESGEDNSPRFDNPLGAPASISLKDHLSKRTELVEHNRLCNFDTEHCMRNYFWVKDVLFNSILTENLRALAKIAAHLKRDEYVTSLNRDADAIAAAMRERMFEDGVYWSTMGAEYTKLKVATWTHFMPLFAGLYTEEEAKAVVSKHLKNPDTFYAPFGIRTTSIQEMSYRSESGRFFVARSRVDRSALVHLSRANEIRIY